MSPENVPPQNSAELVIEKFIEIWPKRIDVSTRGELISGKTVLMTVGAGFIGSHLVEELAWGNEVRLLDDFSSGQRTRLPEDVRVFEGDVRDRWFDFLDPQIKGAGLSARVKAT